MLTKWRMALARLTRRMWFRSALYGGLGIATALAGAFLKFLIPAGLATRIGADSVGNILAILAASMLTVTTFSLSTMVSAYGSASNSATPRAARLLIEDTRAQGALATFIGAFLFSIVGLIALSTGVYGDSGRLVLFGATIAVIVVITITLLRAIEQFSRFGRVGETVDLVEKATRESMRRRAEAPLLGAAACVSPLPDGLARLCSERIGYVEHIDIARLDGLAADYGVVVHVLCQPGTFATGARPVLGIEGTVDGEAAGRLLDTLSIGDARGIENDPRYGLVVLAEVGLRSMSPAINDPGTCIDVIGTCVRLLDGWAAKSARTGADEVRFTRVRVAPLDEADFFEDFFVPVARESAHSPEVQIRLQKAYAAIARTASPPLRAAAAAQARQSLQRAMQALEDPRDRERVGAVALAENGIRPLPAGAG